jgi:hypothetical protein
MPKPRSWGLDRITSAYEESKLLDKGHAEQFRCVSLTCAFRGGTLPRSRAAFKKLAFVPLQDCSNWIVSGNLQYVIQEFMSGPQCRLVYGFVPPFLYERSGNERL